MAMELGGGSLQEPPTDHQLRQVLAAVKYLHSQETSDSQQTDAVQHIFSLQELVHLDIKPQNLVFGRGEKRDVLHLIDFGCVLPTGVLAFVFWWDPIPYTAWFCLFFRDPIPYILAFVFFSGSHPYAFWFSSQLFSGPRPICVLAFVVFAWDLIPYTAWLLSFFLGPHPLNPLYVSAFVVFLGAPSPMHFGFHRVYFRSTVPHTPWLLFFLRGPIPYASWFLSQIFSGSHPLSWLVSFLGSHPLCILVSVACIFGAPSLIRLGFRRFLRDPIPYASWFPSHIFSGSHPLSWLLSFFWDPIPYAFWFSSHVFSGPHRVYVLACVVFLAGSHPLYVLFLFVFFFCGVPPPLS